jgi:hypothetical protein
MVFGKCGHAIHIACWGGMRATSRNWWQRPGRCTAPKPCCPKRGCGEKISRETARAVDDWIKRHRAPIDEQMDIAFRGMRAICRDASGCIGDCSQHSRTNVLNILPRIPNPTAEDLCCLVVTLCILSGIICFINDERCIGFLDWNYCEPMPGDDGYEEFLWKEQKEMQAQKDAGTWEGRGGGRRGGGRRGGGRKR